VLEARHLTPLAKARIEVRRPPLVLSAAYATSTRFFEIQYPDTVAHLPCSCDFTTHFDYAASRLMRRNHGELQDLGIELALQHLEIRVAEPRRVHLNEEIMFAAHRYRKLAQLVRLVVLVLFISECCLRSLMTSPVTSTICAACIVVVGICGLVLVI
jgi:hypothetical protein